MLKTVIAAVAALAIAAPVLAQDPAAPDESVLVRDIELSGLRLVERDGRLFFVSPEGRYVIQGRLFDNWNRTFISSAADFDAVANKLDLKAMGVDTEGLLSFRYGTGEAETIIFADPACPHCKNTMRLAEQLTDKAAFRVVLLPVLGQRSEQLVARLSCELDRPDIKNLMIEGNWSALSNQPGLCEREAFTKTVSVAQTLGIRAVPYVISPAGEVQRGGFRNAEQLARFIGVAE